MRNFITHHPVGVFIGLAFGWAWGWWLPVAGTDMTNLAQVGPMFFICAMVGGLGPSLAGLVVRWTLPPTLRPQLWHRPGWGVLLGALVLVPLTTGVTLLVQGLCGISVQLGEVGARLAIGLVWPLMASVGEEFGWRGLLLPYLSAKGQFWKPALLVGGLWGLWHLPSDWIGLGHLGWWFIPQYLLVGLLNLTLLSVILTALWRRGQGDLRVALVFHYTITASAILLGNQATLTPATMVFATALAQVVLLAVAGLVVFLARPKQGWEAKLEPAA